MNTYVFVWHTCICLTHAYIIGQQHIREGGYVEYDTTHSHVWLDWPCIHVVYTWRMTRLIHTKGIHGVWHDSFTRVTWLTQQYIHMSLHEYSARMRQGVMCHVPRIDFRGILHLYILCELVVSFSTYALRVYMVRHVTHVNEPCHTRRIDYVYTWSVRSHVWMSRVVFDVYTTCIHGQ